MSDELTEKQEHFCREYMMNGGNATQAYKTAYNTENMTDKTINEESCRLKADHKISARIRELQMESKEEFNISVEQKKRWLQHAIMKGFTEHPDREGNMKPHDVKAAISAIGELNKMDGDLAAQKTETKYSLDNFTDEEIAARIRVLMNEQGR
jgi:phage terminase small subunit